jgi:CRP-like cAMP-binding protein
MERHMMLLKSFKRMDQELEQTLRENFLPLALEKGQVLQAPGTLNNNLYFIEKGLLHFFMVEIRRKITLGFRREDQFVLTSSSIYELKDAGGIEALEDCTLWWIPGNLVEELCEKSHRFGLQYHEILLRHAKASKDFSRCSHPNGGPANVDKFRSCFPDLIDRVPTQYLVSLTEVPENKLKQLLKSPIKLHANLNRRLGSR